MEELHRRRVWPRRMGTSLFFDRKSLEGALSEEVIDRLLTNAMEKADGHFDMITWAAKRPPCTFPGINYLHCSKHAMIDCLAYKKYEGYEHGTIRQT